jgi:outer membrane lipoprotein-sorting protein
MRPMIAGAWLLTAVLVATPVGVAEGAPAAAPADEAARLLARADSYRGGWPSFVVRTRITNVERDGRTDSADFDVSVKGENSYVKFLSPRSKGQALLMRGDDMWVFLPDVARPVRITPIQRLLGNVANGDIARVQYAIDYDATIDGAETVDGVACTVLMLAARRPGATYQRIRYVVRADTAMPVAAEFFLTSGKAFKRARFEAPREMAGRTILTRLVIEDAVRTAERSVMEFLDMAPRPLPDKLFNAARTD